MCISADFRYTCGCPGGYAVRADKKTCSDIDECQEYPGICAQLCVNTVGSYTCSCGDGYVAESDGAICKRTDDVDPYLIFGNRYYVRKMNLDGSGFEHVSKDHEYTHVLDYDYKENKVYLVDAGSGQLVEMSLDGEDKKASAIPASYVENTEGIAVDWVGKKLYWTNNKQNGIFVSETNGTSIHVLLRDGSPRPRAIALYPQTGYLYWSDWSLIPFIARVGMDGRGMTKIITEGIYWPNGLTIDFVTNQIWWVDAHLDRIEFSNLDGTNRHTALSSVPHGFSITLFETNVYWTEWNLKEVSVANKYSGKDKHNLRRLVHQPFDIHVVHPTKQPTVANPCGTDNGGCSHLCLLAPGNDTEPSFRCACPETFFMKDDQKTCWQNCSSAQMECGRSNHKCVDMFDRCNGVKDCAGGEDEAHCPAFRCARGMGQFQCKDRSGCYDKFRLCDGTPNCQDSSDEPAECSTRICQPFEFRCTSGQCIPQAWACDGDLDCADRSDEGPLNQQCVPTKQESCDDDQFKCANGKCIPYLWYCDVDDDCGDRSDEPGTSICYSNKSCSDGWVRCQYNYRCIPGTAICNGEDDCRDNSDEAPTQCGKCGEGDFTCANGHCVPLRWVCDRDDDCQDNSDESPELCATARRNCSETEFRCDNGDCISDKYVCDRQFNCFDGSDETDCGEKSTQPYTEQVQCIAHHLHCDGIADCVDLSDEVDCPTRYPGGKYCRDTDFTCNNTLCVPLTSLCNSIQDCGDGSDETLEVCSATPCDASTHFRCLNQRCILNWMVCNDDDDCGDGSDEGDAARCSVHPPNACTGDEFHCKITDRCIGGLQVCNNRNDCGEDDVSDELGCVKGTGQACSADRGGCEQLCKNLPVIKDTNLTSGYICSCNDSYVPDPAAPKSCIDKDECKRLVDNKCTQECANTNGAFFCLCSDGFRTTFKNNLRGVCEPAGRYTLVHLILNYLYPLKKKKKKESKGSIVLSYGNELRLYNTSGGEEYTFWVYWTDSSALTIKRAIIPENSTELPFVQDLKIAAMESPNGLAVDWVTGNIYWSDGVLNNIYVCGDDGNYKATVLSGALYDVKPTMLYFINIKGTPKIMRSYMDGVRVRTLISDDLFDPVALAVDYYMSNRIFWTDLSLGVVTSVNPQGQDRVSLIRDMNRPYNLDVFAGNIIWTSPISRKLMSQDIFGRTKNVTVLKNQFSLHDVKIFSKLKAPDSTGQLCREKNCNALCLLAEVGAVCACPDGSVMEAGSKNLCNLDKYPAKHVEPLSKCSCLNGGSCVFNSNGVPECNCPPDFTGTKCEEKTTRPTPVPTPTPRPSQSTRAPGPGITTISSTNNESVTPVGSTGKEGKSSMTLAIAIPVTLIAIALIVIIIVIVVYMHRQGTLGGRKRLRGEFRSGAPGDGRVSVHMHNGETGEFQTPEVVMPFDGETQFANPMYDTLQNATDAATVQVSSEAGPLPPKGEMDA
ncbi:hypothetical protein CAPTEDRAFT_170076 [Capitella teleta]|uniref:EGF-like domain-containing protein n=1 Tax=Capitella teleta TaxID=283909 RepID=R7VDF3_CAPTE|nr:hypothetical protein CAPTEDRAFT_170076 [Capitella teleta]|eukprot:ELU16597.1 hypothetical protein CAPTEDRAFT_170076 [Capitella teleta]